MDVRDACVERISACICACVETVWASLFQENGCVRSYICVLRE